MNEVPQKGYFLRSGYIYRNGVEIGVFGEGGVEMHPGFEKYAIQAAKLVKNFKEDGLLPPLPGDIGTDTDEPAAGAIPAPRRILTLRELIDAMQPYIAEPCPPMKPWLGDETPEVKGWINKYDEVRRSVCAAGK